MDSGQSYYCYFLMSKRQQGDSILGTRKGSYVATPTKDPEGAVSPFAPTVTATEEVPVAMTMKTAPLVEDTSSVSNPMLQNPMVQDAIQQAVNEAVQKAVEDSNSVQNESKSHTNEPPPKEPKVYSEDVKKDAFELGVGEEEFVQIKQWTRNLRIAMLVVATSMILLALSNLSTDSMSTFFMCFYILFFACLLCAFELSLATLSKFLLVNFGFLYNSKARSIFLVLVGILCYQMSIFGKVVFAMILFMCVAYSYISWKHPKFEYYVKRLHLKDRAGLVDPRSVAGFMPVPQIQVQL